MVATNPSGATLTLQLGDTSSGFYVREFTGLDPVKATIVSTQFANQDGAQYQSATLPTRNITFTVALDPDPAVNTVRGLRTQLYNFFMSKAIVTMTFYVDDDLENGPDGYQITGRVESLASVMFTDDPTVVVSVICFDPDFIDPVTQNVTGLTTADTAATHVAYSGTSDCGAIFTLNVANAINEFMIYYVDANQVTWTLDFQAALLVGDVVTISTVPGNKYATLLRGGVSSSILYGVSPQATWPQFSPGDNWIRFYSTGPANQASFSYNTRYGGL